MALQGEKKFGVVGIADKQMITLLLWMKKVYYFKQFVKEKQRNFSFSANIKHHSNTQDLKHLEIVIPYVDAERKKLKILINLQC